jgi:asparagine synthase (glutamine-hydrolysing)
MCGILGIINRNRSQVDLALLTNLNQIIEHRGPDDQGAFIDNGIGLAHQRLSIVDLSPTGHQPMVSSDSNFVIVFNGEIYNHFEIREKLKSLGCVFKGGSDTETILEGYRYYGTSIFEMLNGIFALAIYDKKRKKCILARDQYGVKPLYFYKNEDVILFSSEIKGLTQHPKFQSNLDKEAVVNYLSFLWCPGEGTLFDTVKKLEPGFYLEYDLDSNKIEKFQFYQIPFTGKYDCEKNEKELIFELEYKLFESVKRQLMGDVPIGFFLSGGLDSSLIVAMAKQILKDEKLKCFTINSDGFTAEGFVSDLYYSKKLAKELNLDLNIIEAEVDILKDFDKMIWHLDEPQADPAPLHVYNICRAAKNEGIKVLLGGVAGDDLFSGYRRHQALYYERYYSHFPSQFFSMVNGLLAQGNSTNPTLRRVKKLLSNSSKTSLERMAGYFSWIPLDKTYNLLSKSFQSELKNYDPNSYFYQLLEKIPNEKDRLNQMLFWELKTFLPAHNLNYTDKMSMATGVEARVPFLDVELVDFSTKIPPQLKMKGLQTKHILKKVAEKYLPLEIIYRPKSGFGAPVRKWITNDLEEMISERLNPSRINERGIFNSKAVWALIEDNKKGKIDASYTIWSLLAIESWMQQFVDKKKLNN